MDYLIDLAADPAAWAALAALIVMEVVLGIDNLIFISILTNKLPEHQRSRARRIGISMALVMRIALLGSVAYIVQLTSPIITVLDQDFSWRDIILLAGGLFLIWKATKEIRHNVDPDPGPDFLNGRTASLGFAAAIGQILLLDMVFLQQDAFDEVDACMPRERQVESLRLLKSLIDRDYSFENRDEARMFFTKMIGLYKNWNYSPQDSPEYVNYKTEIERTVQQP